MGGDAENFEPGGGGPKGIEELFHSSGTGGVAFGGIDVGTEPPGGAFPDQLSAHGCATDLREEYK